MSTLSLVLPQLPPELWLLIAHFIPRQMLKDLISVNRAFFFAQTAERYREVSFFQMDQSMMRLVERLQVPLVRDCVRVLRVRPYFIQGMLAVSAEDRDYSSSYSQTTEALDVVSTTQRIFASLTNLTEYHLVWFELPFIGDIPIQILRAPIVGSGSGSLRKLFLEASLDKLEKLLACSYPSSSSSVSVEHTDEDGDLDGSVLDLPQLEELIISVRQDYVSGGRTQPNLSVDGNQFPSLSSFLIRVRTTLRRFSFSSAYGLDYSPLFESLHPHRFPLLNELCFSIPTQSPHLGDPSALARWMTKECMPCLSTLTFKLYFVDNGLAWEESFREWIEGFVQANRNSDDCTSAHNAPVPRPALEISSLRLSSGFQPASIYLLVRHFSSSPALVSLDVTGNYMTFAQAGTLLSSLSPPDLGSYFDFSHSLLSFPLSTSSASGLRILHLGPVTLSPELVDMLAEKLPELEELNLKIRDVVPRKDEEVVYTYNSYAYAHSDESESALGLSMMTPTRTDLGDALPDHSATHALSSRGSFTSNLNYHRSTRRQNLAQVEWFFEVMRGRRYYPMWSRMRKVEVWKLNRKGKMQYQPRYVEVLEGCIRAVESVED